ncbi:hypothetical protein [Robiginitalea sediminis]|uniref:hypothetical protein n=1 Tax=Robiginitalea sediminis TaxID=1982593 RepID=UPI000B4B110C|nr:hypothetical protein [Robiginitalea sediminis]
MLYVNLGTGVLWLLWGFGQVWFSEKVNWIDYGWFVISGAYLLTFLYMWHFKYLTLAEGILKINGPFGKSVTLSKITHIRKFAGDFILHHPGGKFKINGEILDPQGREQLEEALRGLDAEWT